MFRKLYNDHNNKINSKNLPLQEFLIFLVGDWGNMMIIGNGSGLRKMEKQYLDQCQEIEIMFFQDGMGFYHGWLIENGQKKVEKILIMKCWIKKFNVSGSTFR